MRAADLNGPAPLDAAPLSSTPSGAIAATRRARRGPSYEDLIRRTGLHPAVVREIEVCSWRGDVRAYLRCGDSLRIPGHGLVRYEEDERGVPMVSMVSALHHTRTWLVPRVEPKLRPAPATAEEYWARSSALAAQVAAFQGRMQFSGGREAGWLSIAERLVAAIAVVIGPSDVVTVALDQTLGRFDVKIGARCAERTVGRYVLDLTEWAEAAAERRCMVSGERGWRGPIYYDAPFEAVLSDRIRALPDPIARDRLYPPFRPPNG